MEQQTKIDKPTISLDQIKDIISKFDGRSFSTHEFIVAFQEIFPEAWSQITAHYKKGGAGAGVHFSAFSRIAHTLAKEAKAGNLDKLDYRQAPAGWGSRVIRYWAASGSSRGGTEFPNEIPASESIIEGAKQTVIVNKYERSSIAREKCIEKWGLNCAVCGFDFETFYGPHGAGFIHVHHLKPLKEIGEAYEVDPEKDLRPVCPNCHAMLHRASEVLSIEQLQEIISKQNSMNPKG